MQRGVSYSNENERGEGSGSLRVLSRPALRLALRTPASLHDITAYAGLLLEGAALLVDYSTLGADEAVRAMDYLSGVAYALDDSEFEISVDVLLYLPPAAEAVKG